MAEEVSQWHQRGLIDRATKEQLDERYDARGLGFVTLLKWLGVYALSMLGSAVLAFIGQMIASALVGAIALAGATYGLARLGHKLAIDPAGRHPMVASVLLAVTVMSTYGIVVLTIVGLGIEPSEVTWYWPMMTTAAFGAALAYRYRLRTPLLIGLLFFFHGLGSWHQYLGGGTYAFDIQDPRMMAWVAFAVAAAGLYHERVLEETTLKEYAGFGHLYVVLGLLYGDVSLLIMSFSPRIIGGPAHLLPWVLIFTAACLAQIALGARLKDSRLTGFGITFLAIDLYTRYFETFWDRFSAGIFFFIAGAIGLGLGLLFEMRLRAVTLEQETLA